MSNRCACGAKAGDAHLPACLFIMREATVPTFATPDQIEAARDQYGNDDVEIDDADVRTSEGEGGTWIAAWVWLADAED